MSRPSTRILTSPTLRPVTSVQTSDNSATEDTVPPSQRETFDHYEAGNVTLRDIPENVLAELHGEYPQDPTSPLRSPVKLEPTLPIFDQHYNEEDATHLRQQLANTAAQLQKFYEAWINAEATKASTEIILRIRDEVHALREHHLALSDRLDRLKRLNRPTPTWWAQYQTHISQYIAGEF